MRQDGDINGVGVELVENGGAGPIRLKVVHPGSPAQKAGLRPGDEIVKLDRLTLKGMTSEQVMGLIQPVAAVMSAAAGFNNVEMVPAVPPPQNTEAEATRALSLLVSRAGEKPHRVKLEPMVYRAETVLGVRRDENNRWDYFVDRKKGIAHIRITHLGKGTATRWRRAPAPQGRRAPRPGPRPALVPRRLPCRGRAGRRPVRGQELIVRVRNRGDGEQKYTNTVPKDSRVLDLPLVVLVNGETSGGAELIVAALQDYKRAVRWRVSGRWARRACKRRCTSTCRATP